MSPGSPLLATRFAARAAEAPDALAVVAAGEQVGYGELARRAAAVAARVAGERRIALLARSDADSLAVALGAMAAGTSLVLLHRHLTEQQLARVLRIAAPALVVTPASRTAALRPLGTPLRTPQELTRPAPAVAPPAAAPPAVAPPEGAAFPPPPDPAAELLVGLTSGTSGEPKLFVRDQASWATTLDRSDDAFDVGPGDRVAAPGALDHSHYFYGALHALTRGAAVDLRPLEESFAPGTATTHAYLVPTLAVRLAELLGERTYPALRELLSSAAPWPAQARNRLAQLAPGAAIAHFYGASELSFVALDATRDPAPPGSAGRPFAGVEVEIRDPGDGSPLPDGEQGVVHVRSDMLFSGYLTEQGLTGGPDSGGWATVGDLGTLRGGCLTLAGRASDTIISGGLNVEPAEVEAALAALPGVAAVACVALPDPRWGEIPVAVLIPAAPAPAAPAPAAPAPAAPAPAADLTAALPTRAEVRAHARATLPAPSRPHRVFALDALPLSPRGKLQRSELVAALQAGAAIELE
ncbi:AMP-binding protein [Conexibacter sp. JD483]|uniref:AMP-binding protein n=1 Tax=unclassified Conexibacter TaxID=2627773 RepID=UPI002720F897|nr:MULTISPECIES: AMP-binding protein [unclassified Conexibacter]MDO8188750.1 AMP-binding protein [Conexibacter sp. CPCC 205706]MDO8199902.1 AMP-binding protein [Conexibacter sp. CPCC 205762]MDR9371163.1 AMP-binding protein [Conexibacter sp. JD483]